MRESEILNHTPNSWRNADPRRFKVMVAEDDHSLRRIVVKALSAEGYQMIATEGGTAVLPLVAEEKPDLIVMDVMMPGMDGLEIVRRLREMPEHASTYVILVTGKTSLNEKLDGFESGADDYLTKPVQIGELRARVKAGIRIRALQRDLERTYRHLVRHEKNATIGQLASGISHEFNNIISGINGYAQLAKKDDRFKDRLIEIALQQAQRVQKITGSLSTYASSIGTGKEPTSVEHLVESAQCLLEKEIQSHDIQIEYDLPEALPFVRVDFGPTQQLLVNVLLNAIQSVENGGRIEIRAQTQEGFLNLEVDDNGKGIPDDVKHRIFDPFYTTNGALGGGDGPGIGLGLVFALNTAESHGGTLELVASRLGGACFRLSLPISAALRKGDADDPSSQQRDETPRIVLVEDDECMREIIQEVLCDYTLAVFSEGPPAVEYCRRHSVDLAIVDLTLAGPWSGERVITELAGVEPPPPILLSTGAIEQDRTPTPPVVGVLKKPFEIVELESAVRDALDADPVPASE